MLNFRGAIAWIMDTLATPALQRAVRTVETHRVHEYLHIHELPQIGLAEDQYPLHNDDASSVDPDGMQFFGVSRTDELSARAIASPADFACHRWPSKLPRACLVRDGKNISVRP